MHMQDALPLLGLLTKALVSLLLHPRHEITSFPRKSALPAASAHSANFRIEARTLESNVLKQKHLINIINSQQLAVIYTKMYKHAKIEECAGECSPAP